METTHLLQQIKTALQLSHEETLNTFKLAALTLSPSRVSALLSEEESQDPQPCTYEELGAFLDGLVILKRGPSPKKQDKNTPVALTNNLILKKLRIALELKDPEIEIIFALADITLSKQELKSLFRSEGHKNFRACSEDLLLAFIEGLNEFYYIGEED